MNRVVAYVLSAAIASLFYILWTSIEVGLGFAFFFWLGGGFAFALLILGLVWTLAVMLYQRSWPAGWAYFMVIGAVFTFTLGCATSSLFPKPLFVEDQTFFQGALIAAQRQGVCMAVAGILQGLTYWILTEKVGSQMRR